jgi:hypothetical protein
MWDTKLEESGELNIEGMWREEKVRGALHPKCRSEKRKVSSIPFLPFFFLLVICCEQQQQTCYCPKKISSYLPTSPFFVFITMLSPLSMVMVLWKRRWQHHLLFFILFILFWSFWSSLLKLTINNEIVVFFNVEGCNG